MNPFPQFFSTNISQKYAFALPFLYLYLPSSRDTHKQCTLLLCNPGALLVNMPEGLREDPYHWTDLPLLNKDYYYYYYYYYYYNYYYHIIIIISGSRGSDGQPWPFPVPWGAAPWLAGPGKHPVLRAVPGYSAAPHLSLLHHWRGCSDCTQWLGGVKVILDLPIENWGILKVWCGWKYLNS